MAENATVARPYAEAVYRLAAEKGTTTDWSVWLGKLSQIVQSSEFQHIIGHPSLKPERLVKFLVSFVQGAEGPFVEFLRTVVANHRLVLLPQISLMFEQMKHQGDGVKIASIESAFPLSEAQIQQLVAELEPQFSTRLQPTVSVVPELIGGVRVTVGDRVLDASVKGKLEAMASSLKN